MPTDEAERETPEDAQRRARFGVLDLSAVGLAFPVALLLGYFGGRLIGGWLGNASLGAMIGVLFGIAGGFYNLFKMVSRLAPRTSGASAPTPLGSRTAGLAGSAAADDAEPEDFDEEPLLDDVDPFEDEPRSGA
jgi:hypothetical protein